MILIRGCGIVQEELKNRDMNEQEDLQSGTDKEEIEVIDPEIVEETNDDSGDRMKELEKEKQEYYERLLRLQAEYDNFKKRTQKERIAERKYKAQDIATELLPVLDNFERALQVEATKETESLIEGITMVYNQFKEAFSSQEIKEIETVGTVFDPNLHHAVMQVEEEGKDKDEVVEELQKGYILHDRVIRPAMVKVNK